MTAGGCMRKAARMNCESLKEGREYENQYGTVRRVILEIIPEAYPEQSDPSTVKYRVTKTSISRGNRNGMDYVGCCTIDRFARWAYVQVG